MDRSPFPLVKPKVWKVRACDNIEDPKMAAAFLVHANNAVDAAVTTRRTESFVKFAENFPDAEIVSIEFIGEMS